LKQYNKNYKKTERKIKSNLKPKGKILIILSYNEPFIMSIIPIMNALIAGNEVLVKPSRKALEFFERIWIHSEIKKDFELRLEIFEHSKEKLFKIIPEMNAVYFFGGYENAIKLGSVCSESLVEFHPEVEAADCKIVYLENTSDENIKKDIKLTIHDSLLHTGQSCQRIQGIFINDKYNEKYKDLLQLEIDRLIETKEIENYIPKDYQPNDFLIKTLDKQFQEIDKTNLIRANTKSGFPYLICNPPVNGEFIKSAQFLPTLWISKYDELDNLINTLNSRRYKLGINIFSDNKEVVQKIIDSTNFTRFTTNTCHTFVRYDEGWGGISPTGFNGYISWIEKFSYPYTVISD